MTDKDFIQNSTSVPLSERNLNISEKEKKDHSNIAEPSTYLCIGEQQNGQLEIDLIQFREKNVSMRYLSFTFSGINPKTGEIQSSFINIDNEEAFDVIKNFFKQLDWNS